MNHPNPSCPMTLFEHADEGRSERFVEPSFLELVEFISDQAGERFQTEAGPWLFTPCQFRDGIRRADHVVQSGLVMLEVQRGLTLDVAAELLGGNTLAGSSTRRLRTAVIGGRSGSAYR